MRKQHEDSIEAYKTESADCEKRQEQIKIQNRQNYEKYHEGQMNQKQFMEEKMQLEEERERLQKRVQELGELINGEKEILMKKNVPVEQMLMYLGYEKLTREMLEEYVQGILICLFFLVLSILTHLLLLDNTFSSKFVNLFLSSFLLHFFCCFIRSSAELTAAEVLSI